MAVFDEEGIPLVLGGRNYRVVFEGEDAVRVMNYRSSSVRRLHTYKRWDLASGRNPPNDVAEAIALAREHKTAIAP